jgi:hypothetical protein
MIQREFKHGVPDVPEVKISPRVKIAYGFLRNPWVIFFACATIFALMVIWKAGHMVNAMPPVH